MSLTDFFVAEEDEIASVADLGPAGHLPTVQSKGADPVKLATLTGIATGRDHSLSGAFYELLDEVRHAWGKREEGPWIYAVPDRLVSALRDADAERLATMAATWAATEEWTLDRVPADDLQSLLADVADLARHAEPPKRLYVWMSL